MYLVEFQYSQLDLLLLVLDLLGGGVILLLALLSATPEPEHQMERRLFLDIIIGQSPAILKLFAGKDQPLLIRRDSFFVLDLGLNILDSIGGFDLESDGLTRKGFHEDLHGDGTLRA